MALLAECPVCRRPLRWTYMLRPMWSEWACDGCGSLLGLNRKRRLAAILPFVGLALAVVGMAQFAGGGLLVALPAILAIWVPYFLLLDRAVVLEERGFRCKQCGYDLRGQVVPRCPECGREFDADERASLRAGAFASAPVRPRRRLWLTLALVLLACVAMGGMLAVGTQRYFAARSRPTSAPALATQAVPPAGEAGTSRRPPGDP
jgi:uncharacterized protein (DUF983 family)